MVLRVLNQILEIPKLGKTPRAPLGPIWPKFDFINQISISCRKELCKVVSEWARRWCLILCYILFKVNWSFGNMMCWQKQKPSGPEIVFCQR